MDIECAIVDLDGTVYRSSRAVPGAVGGIERLEEAGVDVYYVSNTSTKSRQTCYERLHELGIPATKEQIITAAFSMAAYLESAHTGDRIFALGEQPVYDELERVDVTVVDDPAAADVLAVGKDYAFDYDDLCQAYDALQSEDVAFVVTNLDATAPVDGSEVPGTGAIVGAIEGATGREPDVLTGKPGAVMTDLVQTRSGTSPSNCVVIGDNPTSDIEMGRRAGMTTALVLSGITTMDDIRDIDVPDYVLDSLGEIGTVLAG